MSADAAGDVIEAIRSPLITMSSPVITDDAGKFTVEYKAAIDAYIQETERQFELRWKAIELEEQQFQIDRARRVKKLAMKRLVRFFYASRATCIAEACKVKDEEVYEK